jgi:hypothetical protein
MITRIVCNLINPHIKEGCGAYMPQTTQGAPQAPSFLGCLNCMQFKQPILESLDHFDQTFKPKFGNIWSVVIEKC